MGAMSKKTKQKDATYLRHICPACLCKWGLVVIPHLHVGGALLPTFASHFRVSETGEIIIRKKVGKGVYLRVFGCVVHAVFAFVRE